jgi:hypothetical protein
MRTLASIATGDKKNLLIEHGLFPKIENLLSHEKSVVRREVCSLMSKLATGTMVHVDTLIQNKPIIKKVV